MNRLTLLETLAGCAGSGDIKTRNTDAASVTTGENPVTPTILRSWKLPLRQAKAKQSVTANTQFNLFANRKDVSIRGSVDNVTCGKIPKFLHYFQSYSSMTEQTPYKGQVDGLIPSATTTLNKTRN